jgi:hypothetical protein
MRSISVSVTSISIALLGAACGGDDGPCNVQKSSGCDDNQVCEQVQDSTDTVCATPIIVTGRVFNLDTNAGVAGATILGLDANNSAITPVAVSDSTGKYELILPVLRTADGAPTTIPQISLRADATGYVTFPSGIRPALPVDTSAPVDKDGKLVIQSSVTDIGLLPVAAGGPSVGTIHGKIAPNAAAATALVVAEANGMGFTAFADRKGEYTIFNVPAGDASVAAYARGYNYTTGTASVAAGKTVEVNLDVADESTSTVSGSVTFVDPGSGLTSVILVVESTFNTMLTRGQTPPGLRAPDPGIAPNVAGTFSISGVPAGKYVVLAGFENDNFVRDESATGGTSIVHVTVAAGTDLPITTSFKVTGSLTLVSPGANGVETVTGTPTFKWLDDPSADQYEVTVYDSYGNINWMTTVNRPTVMAAYQGPGLKNGNYYQWRVRSVKTLGNQTLSRSEDLEGVFYVP